MTTAGSVNFVKPQPPSIPHVLYVADCEVVARLGCMFRQLGLALDDEGVRVALLTDDAAAAAELDGTPVEDHYFPALRGWGAWRLYGYLRRQFLPPPDVVHLWGAASLGYFSDWTLNANAALVIHVTSLSDFERIVRRGVRENETLIASCGRLLEMLRERWPTLAENFRVMGPALLPPERVEEFSARGRTLGLIWTGTIDRQCGLDVLIEAVSHLVAKGYDLQTALIGRGPATDHYWREIKRRGVAGSFSLIDEPAVWNRAMAGADVYVVPNRQEALSLAPLLAMAHGKVVIASRDQIADWFVENQTCLQFTPGSAVELAYHVTRTVVEHPAVLTVSRAAAEYVRDHHLVTKLATRLARLYCTLRGNADNNEGGLTVA